MTKMRAKLQIGSITPCKSGEEVVSEQLHFHGVSRNNGYPEDGSDEDNTFARLSPSVSLDIMIANPALIGKFKEGEKFYVDFTPADQPSEAVDPQA